MSHSKVSEESATSKKSSAEIKFHDTIIIGSGFSGIGLAMRMQKKGRNDFLILEKADSAGGCWRDNSYPGAACDIPSHLYSYSFEQNPNWNRKFSGQSEIVSYIESCIEKHQLASKIAYKQEVAHAEFDADKGLWNVSTLKGEQYQSRFFVSATGQLNRPAIPSITGMDNFEGTVFHSAQWDQNCDLKDKRVAVIGTGASAIQFIPAIVDKVASLNVFQRSAPYVLAKKDRAYKRWEQGLLNKAPWVQSLVRLGLYLKHESVGLMFGPLKKFLFTPKWIWKRFMHKQISDPGLREKLTPDYEIGCKRVLIASDYYPSLARNKVKLDISGIEKITNHSVISKEGTEYPVDVIIYGTGFKSVEFLAPMKITGLNDQELNIAWQQGAEAYKGISVAGFPNLMMLYGPNTNSGHNSIIYLVESQIQYILDYMDLIDNKNLRFMNVKPSSQKNFNDRIQQRLESSIWNTGGCNNWYLAESGKNTNNWPGFSYSYRKVTKRFELNDYEQVPY